MNHDDPRPTPSLYMRAIEAADEQERAADLGPVDGTEVWDNRLGDEEERDAFDYRAALRFLLRFYGR